MKKYYIVDDRIVVKKENDRFYSLDAANKWVENGRLMDMYYDAAYDFVEISEEEALAINIETEKYYTYNNQIVKLDNNVFYLLDENNDWIFAQHLATIFKDNPNAFIQTDWKEQGYDLH